jgi:hypothetical protein
MAVPTADLAGSDLPLERGQAALQPRQRDDRAPLRSDVIELEHHGIALTAVHAGGRPEHRRDELEISQPPRSEAGSPRRAARGGTSLVAVAADDLAFCDFRHKSRERQAVVRERRDILRFAGDMVVLQYNRVTLSAVDARVRDEVRKEESLRPSAPFDERRI